MPTKSKNHACSFLFAFMNNIKYVNNMNQKQIYKKKNLCLFSLLYQNLTYKTNIRLF